MEEIKRVDLQIRFPKIAGLEKVIDNKGKIMRYAYDVYRGHFNFNMGDLGVEILPQDQELKLGIDFEKAMLLLEDKKGIEFDYLKEHVDKVVRIVKNFVDIEKVALVGIKYRCLIKQTSFKVAFDKLKKKYNVDDDVSDMQFVFEYKDRFKFEQIGKKGNKVSYGVYQKDTLGPMIADEYVNHFTFVGKEFDFESIFLDTDYRIMDSDKVSISLKSMHGFLTKTYERVRNQIERLREISEEEQK